MKKALVCRHQTDDEDDDDPYHPQDNEMVAVVVAVQ